MDGYTMQEIIDAAERAKAATIINGEGHGSFNTGATCMFANFVSEMTALSTRQIVASIEKLNKAFVEAV